MNRNAGIICLGLMSLACASVTVGGEAFAAGKAKVAKSHWAGSSLAVNGNRTRGNSNNTALNALGKITYTNMPWKSLSDFSYDYGKNGGTLNTNRYSANQQINYYAEPTEPDYFFGLGTHMDDRLGPFRRQSLFALGIGRDLLRTKRFSLSAQIGPGVRVDKPKNKPEDTDFIIASKASFSWQVSDQSTFKQEVRYDHGFSTYGFLKTTTAFSVRVIDRLSMQASYVVDYYTRLPSGLENRNKKDTRLMLGLLFDID